MPFPVRERLQHVFDLFLQQHNGRHVAWIFCPSILDEVAEIGFFALAHWRLERDRLLRHFQDRSNAINWQEHFFSHLFGRRLSPVFLHELFLHSHELVNGFDHVHGNSDRASLVGNRTRDGLTNPPRRVSGKFITAAILEFLNRLHESHVALLD